MCCCSLVTHSVGLPWREVVLGLRRPDWGTLTHLSTHYCLLHCHSLTKLLQRILSLQLFKLSWRVLVQELIDSQVPSSHSDVDLVLIHSYSDPLATEFVHALRFPQEHDLEFVPVWVVVDELSQFVVNGVVLDRDVDSHTRF